MDCAQVWLQRLLSHLVELILALLLLAEAMLANVFNEESAVSQSALMLDPRVVVLYSANNFGDDSLAVPLSMVQVGATVVYALRSHLVRGSDRQLPLGICWIQIGLV